MGIRVDPPATVGYGLTSMRQRADELGGTFVVTHGPDGGTTVEVAVPLAAEVRTAASTDA